MEETKVMLKRRYKNLFEKLQQHSIPVFIFSDDSGDELEGGLSIKLIFIIQMSKSCSFVDFDENECSKDLKDD